MKNVKKNKWWKSTIWYLYQFSMISICCITIVILYYNHDLIKLNFDETAKFLLATIGFLFAFAGINIYSIFNTNIEEEKERLRDLQSAYEKEMAFERTQGEYSRRLLLYYQTCQMIKDSQSFNNQIFEWVNMLYNYICDFKVYLFTLYEDKRESSFVSFKHDFCNINRGILKQLNTFMCRIQSSQSSFFNKVKSSDKQYFLECLEERLHEIESLENYDFTSLNKGPLTPKPDKTLSKKLKKIWESFKQLFVIEQ